MSLRVGNKEVIRQETLLITQGESATFTMPLGGQDLNVVISTSQSEGNPPDIKGTVNNNTISLEFINWGDALGHALTEPLKLADTQNGGAVWLVAMGKGNNNAVKLDLQFMIG